MNFFIISVLLMSIVVVSALPAPQAPAAGPFMTLFQTAGGVVAAGFEDAAKFASIFPVAADSALGVGQTVLGRVVKTFNGYAAGK